MPNLFTVSGYKIYFWSNEDGEPIHIHISKGKPSPNSTKIWLTKKGGCIVANNGSQIPNQILLLKSIVFPQIMYFGSTR